MRAPSICAATLSVATALACQATVNVGKVTDTSEPDTDTGTAADTNDATTNPGTTEPGTTDPGTTDANTTDPGTTNPDTTDANTTNPGTTDPNTTDTASSTSGGLDTDSTGSGSDGTTGGDADLDGWTKYREVLIENELSTELKDIQVMVDAEYDTDMAPDWSDIRFTNSAGTQILPHWIEWDTGPANARMWVRVPTLLAEDFTMIRMYYGNPNAASTSSGDDTFLFFEGFDGPMLDPNLWEATAPVTMQSGRLQVTTGSVYSVKPAGSLMGRIVEARMRWTSPPNVDGWGRMVVGKSQSYASLLECISIGDSKTNFLVDGKQVWSYPWETEPPTHEFHIWGVAIEDDQILQAHEHGYGPWQVDLQWDFNFYLTFGSENGKLADAENARDMDIDWVIVRRQADVPPTAIVVGEKMP